MQVTNIKVAVLLDDPQKKMRITWDAFSGATSYKIYASLTPYNNTNLIASSITNLYYETTPPLVDGVYFYFWVTAMYGIVPAESDKTYSGITNFPYDAFETTGSTLSAVGQDYAQDSTLKEYYTEILERELATLEVFGEKAYLYKRRWAGVPCQHKAASGGESTNPGGGMFDPDPTADPPLQPINRCLDCFGTSIYGGYYPKVEILIRRKGIPSRRYKFDERGIVADHDFDSWTIYNPMLTEGDIIVTRAFGERYRITDPKASTWRGLPLHQECSLVRLTQKDIEYYISDTKIADGIAHSIGKPVLNWLMWT